MANKDQLINSLQIRNRAFNYDAGNYKSSNTNFANPIKKTDETRVENFYMQNHSDAFWKNTFRFNTMKSLLESKQLLKQNKLINSWRSSQ